MSEPLAAPPDWLLGAWHLVRAEPPLELQPGTRMEFGASGQLEYAVTVEGHTTRFVLAYQVRGDVLRTESPNSPHSAEVRFASGEDGRLVLDFGGPRAWLERANR